MTRPSRRDILKFSGAASAAGLLGGTTAGRAAAQSRPAQAAARQPMSTPPPGIGSRGYYITFCRIPTAGYDTWRSIFDTFADDGIQHVIMWMGGAFRSRKYPITWEYNRHHANVRHDFVGRLIDYAHTRGVKVLLGFTPYTYDGTNQYALERPDLKGVQANGKLARLQGIDSWGYNLDPTKADARTFMLNYAREMYFDFYPNADGLLIESSDIDICVGGACGGASHYYELEYEFVRQISEDVWAHDPDAQILIHPNYFTGGSNGTDKPYDPRWGLIFSPWTVNLDLVKRASYSYYFDLDVISQSPPYMKASARYVRDHGFAGYLPSQEFFTFVPKHPEIGEPGIVGRQLHPFGIDVIGLDANPYVDPLVSVNRIAYREYMRDPDLSDAEFRAVLGRSVFGDTATDQDIDDLMFLHDCFYWNKSLFSPSAQADPSVLRDNLERGLLGIADLRKIQNGLDALPAVARRVTASRNPRVRALGEHAALMRRNWDPGSRHLLAAHLR
ncbi:twin-arginine translocation signal domain-containing protein [Actinoallomurus iriomotensis]|uniref:Uncharacterized protein n=1 Tax=Actinoallomurus iriomotensis TaxID=478107 RepID=A0A9W6S179_9ACTN|nr:twin-arginine translocation signal domain-containing protein [Actinoallomurus iriomotensis]GLY83777.1 hypothetical protein Airi02_017060 [Actinoallomurus iriomotensis]